MMERMDQELLLPVIQPEHREPKHSHLYAIKGAQHGFNFCTMNVRDVL
jgi:hypothetical protein